MLLLSALVAKNPYVLMQNLCRRPRLGGCAAAATSRAGSTTVAMLSRQDFAALYERGIECHEGHRAGAAACHVQHLIEVAIIQGAVICNRNHVAAHHTGGRHWVES